MESLPKFFFCSFANTDLIVSLLRIKKQAKKMKLFSKIKIFTQHSLTPKGKNNISRIMKETKSKRGYGYWAWKSDIILQMFEIMSDNDILLYCDAGCELNPNGIEKLKQYFELANQHEICAVQLPNSMSDTMYTKIDTIKYFENISSQKLEEGQIQATTFFIKKTEYTIRIMTQWNKLMSYENAHIFDDSPSIESESPQFIAHRHDQSVLSLLLKQNRFFPLSIENFWAEEDQWCNLYKAEPVLFKRNKIFLTRILNKFLIIRILKKIARIIKFKGKPQNETNKNIK